MRMASGDELIEFEGYLVSITPRIRRGLPEYALKIIINLKKFTRCCLTRLSNTQ